MKIGPFYTASYNESHARQLKLRHIFLPGNYSLGGEAIVAFLALLLLNITQFNKQLFNGEPASSPFALWYHPLQQVLSKLDTYQATQQITLFVLWGLVGIVIYVLIFRFTQMYLAAKSSVDTGLEYVREDPERGLVRWLASLHDVFLKILIVIAGVIVVLIGTVVCFGTASQELRNALTGTLPGNLQALLLSLLIAFLGVRLSVIGLCLLSRHFRNWYLY